MDPLRWYAARSPRIVYRLGVVASVFLEGLSALSLISRRPSGVDGFALQASGRNPASFVPSFQTT